MRYHEAHLAYLRSGWPLMNLQDLTAGFNAYFGETVTVNQISSTLKNHRILCGRITGARPADRISDIYSNEQVEFIKIRYRDVDLAQLALEMKQIYDVATSAQQLKTFCHNRKIHSGRTGKFKKGHRSWNKGVKGSIKPNSGSFRKGAVPANIKPIGSTRICPKDGYLLVKVAERNPYTGAPTRYRAKQHIVWEEHHGPVATGNVLIFKDGNKLNCDIENLEVIPRQLHVRLNKIRYWDQPESVRSTLRLTAELQVAIAASKEKRKKKEKS